ncbi:MAG: hypothetical protein OHK0011_16400 [Turneriella sp.]
MTAAHADQFAYVKPDTARKAVELLSVYDYLLELCEPCGDHKGEVIVVTRVESADVNYEGLHEVQINGRGVDLAYIFFKEDNAWKNAAIRLGLAPQGVTGEVPAEAVAQIPAPRSSNKKAAQGRR